MFRNIGFDCEFTGSLARFATRAMRGCASVGSKSMQMADEGRSTKKTVTEHIARGPFRFKPYRNSEKK